MAGASPDSQDRRKQLLDRLQQIHAEAMAKLSDLRQRQLDLYRRVSARLDQEASAKAVEALKKMDNDSDSSNQ